MTKPLEIVQNSAIKAGNFLLENKDKVKLIKEKKKGADFLTTADIEAEKIIVTILHKNFPSHAIFSEESGDVYGGKDFQWVIDPLDGTKHYLKGLPFFAVAITLRDSIEPLISVVFIPSTNEIFTAEKGKGFRLNNKIYRVSNESTIENSIIYVEFPSTKFKVDWKKQDYDIAWKKYEKLTKACFRTRAFGSGPIGMAYTAMGAFDAYVRFQPLSYEDVIGGSLMIKEAGGKITDQHGNPIEMKGNEPDTRVIASNAKIHDQIIEIVKN